MDLDGAFATGELARCYASALSAEKQGPVLNAEAGVARTTWRSPDTMRRYLYSGSFAFATGPSLAQVQELAPPSLKSVERRQDTSCDGL
jgi:hypothetical protein